MSGESIVLVEGNEKITTTLSEPLRKLGYQLTAVQWAEEALSIVQKGSVHAVLAHTKQAGMTGIEFIRDVRRESRFKVRPVILVYGKDDLDIKVQAFKAGADDYLVLPFQIPELVLRLQLRINKTQKDAHDKSRENADMLEIERAAPEPVPPHGSMVSRSLPMILDNIFRRGSTGVLRLIQGRKNIFIYLENGMIRGVKGEEPQLHLAGRLIKWGIVPRPMIRKVREIGRTGNDVELINELVRTLNLSPDRLYSLGCRYIQFGLNRMVRMVKADYQFVSEEDSRDAYLVPPPGIHPLHVLIPAIRSRWLPPSYRLFLPKENNWITPASGLGTIGEVMQLTVVESGMFQLIAEGKSLSHFLTEARQVASHAEQLIHIALAFRVIEEGDKKPVSEKETKAVGIPEPQAEVPTTDLVDDEGEDRERVLERKTDRPVSVEKHPPEIAPHPTGPKSVARESKPGQPRIVRELYPEIPEEDTGLPGAFGVRGFGFPEERLFEGNLSETPFVFLFGLAMEHKKTGVLLISQGTYIIKLFWRKGRILFARTEDPSMRIDQIMVDMGMITPRQKAAVEEMLAETDKMRTGTVIFKKQIVNMVQMSEAVHRQVEVILKSLFNAEKGDYRFDEGNLPDEEHIPLDLPAENLLLNGIREIENTDRLIEYMPALTDTLVQTSRAKESSGQYRLGSTVMNIFDKFRRPLLVREAIVGSEVSPREFRSILLALMLMGLLNYYNRAKMDAKDPSP
ncbi:response regulator [bacterium]|nr:response regulator [candidate division CSSED10-310 bacterium]